jgi:Protocatechuate 3,4-dioxygenase beta subunit
VEVNFAPWGAVSGRVLDENGKPLAGAQVRLWYPDRYGIYLNSEELNYFARPVRTDADGRFRGEGLPPGAKVMLSGVSKNRRLYNPADRSKKAWVMQPGATHDLGDVSVTLTPE